MRLQIELLSQTSYNRFGILKSEDNTVGLNTDGANVNMGQYTGLGKLIKDEASWLEVVW